MPKTFTILSIEDNRPDFELLKKGLLRVQDLSLNIINVSNGEDALRYLYKKPPFQEAILPTLILLDINLPTVSGEEILEVIKTNRNLKKIPVIIISTSDAERDINECYKKHANSYITKTFDINELFSKIEAMVNYWLKTSELPPERNVVYIEEK